MPEVGNSMDVYLAVVQVWLRPKCAWRTLRRSAAVATPEIVRTYSLVEAVASPPPASGRQ